MCGWQGSVGQATGARIVIAVTAHFTDVIITVILSVQCVDISLLLLFHGTPSSPLVTITSSSSPHPSRHVLLLPLPVPEDVVMFGG